MSSLLGALRLAQAAVAKAHDPTAAGAYDLLEYLVKNYLGRVDTGDLSDFANRPSEAYHVCGIPILSEGRSTLTLSLQPSHLERSCPDLWNAVKEVIKGDKFYQTLGVHLDRIYRSSRPSNFVQGMVSQGFQQAWTTKAPKADSLRYYILVDVVEYAGYHGEPTPGLLKLVEELIALHEVRALPSPPCLGSPRSLSV